MQSDRELVARAVREGLDEHNPEIVGGPEAIADKILAALSAAGRLRAEVAGEVVEAVERALLVETMKLGTILDVPHALKIAAPIIAADAERRVRDLVLEEAVAAVDALRDYDGDDRGHDFALDEAENAIRALKEKPYAG